MTLQVRKTLVTVDEVLIEGNGSLETPSRKVVAAAIVVNPFADQTVEDLSRLVAEGAPLGELLIQLALNATNPERPVVSYGKAAVVGARGEVEHAAALLHPRLGKPIRAAIGGGAAVIPSVTKRGSSGAAIDIPLHHKDDEWSFDHFDAAWLCVPDAPADDEIVVAIALADTGRPRARVRPM